MKYKINVNGRIVEVAAGEKVYAQLPVEVKTIDKDAGTLEAIFSTQDVDRHGDTVMQDGWDLKNFKKNPVILNSHNYDDAAEVIGKASEVRVEARKLQGKITFAVNENPKAKVIFDLYAGGFLNAFSVGFIPSKFKENKDGTTDWWTIEEAELLEVSAVSVPANARALAKSKGIDVDALPETKAADEPEPEATPEPEETPAADPAPEETPAPEPTPEPEHTPEPEPTPTPQPKHVSHNAIVMKAIHRIESREKMHYRKAAVILQSLLDGDEEGKQIERAEREMIRKRKVNQAIRLLLKAK